MPKAEKFEAHPSLLLKPLFSKYAEKAEYVSM